MKQISTQVTSKAGPASQVTTYEPELIYYGDQKEGDPGAVMFPVEDGTGFWVSIVEHKELVRKLQERITILENYNHEMLGELTGDRRLVMRDVQRYDHDGDIMRKYDNGDFVEYGDYYELEKKYEKLVSMVTDLYREV